MDLRSSREGLATFTRTTLATALWLTIQPLLLVGAESNLKYRLLTSEEVDALPRNKGDLGVDVEQAQEVSAGGMTFTVIRVVRVHNGLAGSRAGLTTGDQVIAVDGRVFPDVAAFTAYVGSKAPDSQVDVDYVPSGRGPKQAQRVNLVVGADSPTSTSLGRLDRTPPPVGTAAAKAAIGEGVASLLGCSEIDCFSHPTSPGGDRLQGQTQK